MKHNDRRPDPTPEEIAAMCAEFRKNWPHWRWNQVDAEDEPTTWQVPIIPVDAGLLDAVPIDSEFDNG